MKRSPFICIFFVIFLFGMVACEDPNPSSAYPADKAYNLNVPSYFPKPIIPADNPLTENKVLLGRMLFYDPILSLDSSVSCASCHEQQFAFGDNKALSKKVGHGSTKRNSSVLFNLAFTNSFFWDGRTNTLEATCLDALIDEQQFDFKFVKPRIEKDRKSTRLNSSHTAHTA
jgi:cytochrome c peroxidase